MKLKEKDLIENCGYYPCIVLDNNGENVLVYNVIKQEFDTCSITQCITKILTVDEFIDLIEIYKKEGEYGFFRRHGYSKKQYMDFCKKWR